MAYAPFASGLSTVRPFGGFQETSLASQSSTSRAKVAPKPRVLDLPALQTASRLVQDQLIKDAQIIPDLGEMINARTNDLFPLLCTL